MFLSTLPLGKLTKRGDGLMNQARDNSSQHSSPLTSEDRRCLEALAVEGGFGARALREGYLALARRHKGITLAVSLVRARTGDRLVQRGFAEWIARGSAARLLITASGRAALSNVERPKDLSRQIDVVLQSIEAPEGRRDVFVNQRESPLLWLARRKGAQGQPLISTTAFIAGERLRADFERAGLSPRVSIDWSRFGMGASSRGGTETNASDAMLAARMRMRKAIDAMGERLAGPVIDICCFLKGLELVERERGWKKRSAKHVLAEGLAILARHYGLQEEAKGTQSSSHIRVAAEL